MVIAKRLLAAYAAATETGHADRTDVWTDIAEAQPRFSGILHRGNPEELAAYLVNVSRHDASVGITQGDAEFARLSTDRAYRNFVGAMAYDKLIMLGEAVGVLPVENPEQGTFGRNGRQDAGELVRRIALRVGIPIDPPDIDGGLFKIDTGHGLFGERDFNAIYTAWLLRILTAGMERPRVCEIGGGSGRVAHWAQRFGLTSYTMIDLPTTSLVQGYYVLKTTSPERVLLYGESDPDPSAPMVRVLPTHAINDLGAGSFDVVLNQDSFPEINEASVREYLDWTKVSCANGRLVSINHESKPHVRDGLGQLSVPETIERVGGFALEQRWPYWLRLGYVTEVYGVRGG